MIMSHPQVIPMEGQLRDFSSAVNNILTELSYENLRNHIYRTLLDENENFEFLWTRTKSIWK